MNQEDKEGCWRAYLEAKKIPIIKPQKVTLQVMLPPELTSEEGAQLICEFLNENYEIWRERMSKKVNGN